jgi:hypothetical protein
MVVPVALNPKQELLIGANLRVCPTFEQSQKQKTKKEIT